MLRNSSRRRNGWAAVTLFLTALMSPLRSATTNEERDFSAHFGDYIAAVSIYDAVHDRWIRHAPDRCRVRVSPCSTFKILNSLIALETGVAEGPGFSLPWDGVQRPIATGNKDHTLRTAFEASCVWFYQELARRVGRPRMTEFVAGVGYGNADVSGELTSFWLSNSLLISPDEQVEFLGRLHAGQVPFSRTTVETVLDLMVISSSSTSVYRGKTGTAGSPAGDVTLGWWVGSVASADGKVFFATCITGGANPSGRTARRMTESLLSELGMLPSVE